MNCLIDLLPLNLFSACRASKVPLSARLNAFLFGAPNARRANGIISTRFDVGGWFRRLKAKATGCVEDAPVFQTDRLGWKYGEKLPRIWLSERISNTRRSDGSRIFVESYPAGPDAGGVRALELGDRYLGEGSLRQSSGDTCESLECFKAAEILYLHSVRRGNREAAGRLRFIYEEDLCKGQHWLGYIESKAKHAEKKRRPNGRRKRK